MRNKNLQKEIISGSFWSIFGQFASLLVVLVTNIWLARLLSPSEFGQIGVIMFFITIMSVLTESGLGGALVRNKTASLLDYSTAFVTNLVFSIGVFLGICIFADNIAHFYNDEELKSLLVVSSTVILINAFQISQNAKLVSDLRFKQKYVYKFVATVLASVVAIILAFYNWGVWSLVALQILNSLAYTVLLFVFEGAYLSFRFSKESIKKMGAFGVNTTVSSLLNSVFDNIYQLALAKYFSMGQTGNFYQAKRLQDVPGGVLNVVSQGVIFSSLAKLQDDKPEFIRLYQKIGSYFAVLLGLITIVFYVYAESIINILLGPKWTDAVYFIKLLSIASFFYMQETFNRVIFKVYDRTQYILLVDILKKSVQGVTIAVGIYYLSLEILIYGLVASSVIGYVANVLATRQILKFDRQWELTTIFKILLVSCVIISVALSVFKILNLDIYWQVVTIPFVAFIYIIAMEICKVINISSYLAFFRKNGKII